mgnify:CR=1 FL=1
MEEHYTRHLNLKGISQREIDNQMNIYFARLVSGFCFLLFQDETEISTFVTLTLNLKADHSSITVAYKYNMIFETAQNRASTQSQCKQHHTE